MRYSERTTPHQETSAMRQRSLCISALFSLAFLCVPQALAQGKPWPIRAVIVTTFEVGADTGDIPGELQFWGEGEHLDEGLELPGGPHPLRTNATHPVLGMVSGTTLVNATASMMA